MNTPQRRRLLGGILDPYAIAIRSLSPTLWYRLNELSGAAAINSGSLGAVYNGVNTAVTLAQASGMGGIGAYKFNALTSKVTIPAGLHYPVFTRAFLVKPATRGQGNFGRFFDLTAPACQLAFGGSLNAISAQIASGGNALSTTTTGITAGLWQWVFETYDNAGDRKIRLYHGISGLVSQYAYSTQTAATGTITDQSGATQVVGSNAGQTRTFDGWIDEYLLFNRILTNSEMALITQYTPPAVASPLLVFVGDSIILGFNATNQYGFAQQMSDARPTYPSTNLGVSSRKMSEMATGAAALAAGLLPIGTNSTAMIFGGTNDIAAGVTGADTYVSLLTCCGAWRTAGYKVIVCTMLPRSAGTETERAAYNALIVANWATFADVLADFAADPVIGQAGQNNNATYYAADHVHPIDAGHAKLLPIAMTALLGLGL